MFVRALATFAFFAALVGSAGQAHAVNEWHILAMQLDAQTRSLQESYVGYGERNGNAFSGRSNWIDLRPMSVGRVGSQRMNTPRTVGRTRRGPLPYQRTTNVGGLGAHLAGGGGEGGSPSLGRITGGGSSTAAAPSFGSLHEGGPSFSFSRP
ncbi:MAG: hypothetical protein ABI321_12905 [Polyangia bacterium]